MTDPIKIDAAFSTCINNARRDRQNGTYNEAERVQNEYKVVYSVFPPSNTGSFLTQFQDELEPLLQIQHRDTMLRICTTLQYDDIEAGTNVSYLNVHNGYTIQQVRNENVMSVYLVGSHSIEIVRDDDADHDFEFAAEVADALECICQQLLNDDASRQRTRDMQLCRCASAI